MRDELGNAIVISEAEVILEPLSGVELKTAVSSDYKKPGINYRLVVPMDSGITSDLYKPTALRPFLPFRLKVQIGRTTYLPIEMRGDHSKIGRPGETTRMDLTLGEDSDGDGIPDAWERALIHASGGALTSLKEIRGDDDFDGDGLSNMDEYLAGTYAFDAEDGFSLEVVRIRAEASVLEFLAIQGRTYNRFGLNRPTVLGAHTVPTGG